MKRTRLMLSCAVAVALTGGIAFQSARAETKRIYLAPDDHTDYMWTADEATYQQVFLESIDYYLDLADSTAANPSEYQSRFNLDGTFWVWTYEQNRSSAQFQRLIDRIRDGHISVPLSPLVITYGGTPTEAILRGMYYAGGLERRFDLKLPLANATENQTLPYGLGALFAGSGAKYSWRGICNCLTKVPDAWDRQYDIYRWVGPDGSSVLMKWNSMLTLNNQSMGGYAEAYNTSSIIDYVDTDSSFKTRYPYSVIGAFGKGWDDLETLSDIFVKTAQQKTTTSRKVIVSNEQDFFEDFEASYGSSLPSLSVTYGNEWDTYTAAMSELSASVRRATEKLRAAEAMAALVSLQDSSFMASRTAARDLAYMALGLYYEHNWCVGGYVSLNDRIAWQRRLASQITGYVDALYTDAAAALGAQIQKAGANTRFFAFNPLSWTRDDYADLPWSDTGTVHVIDLATGLETPSQIVTVDGQRRLRVLAKAIPPVGYKVFEIQPGAGSSFASAATVTGGVIENSTYKVTVADRGAITSLIDKTRGNREFAKSINGRVINDLGSGTGTLTVENAGPVTVTLLATSSSPLSHTTRVTLLQGSDRIDIRNDINQGFSALTTWAYGFNVTAPDVYHEEVGSIIKAKLTSQGGVYSTRNARYDWLTLNHFADMNDGGGQLGVTLSSADTAFFRLGNSTVSSLDTATPQLSPLAGGQVDGDGIGIPSQGGDTHFLQRFALRTHGAYDQTSAMKFSLEHQNPLVTGLVTGGSIYPASSFTGVTISSPDVLLWALKPSEDGTGLTARVWNMASSPVSFTVSLSGSVASAKRLSHIETVLGDATMSGGQVSAQAASQQLLTFLVQQDSGSTGDDDATAPGDDDVTGAGDDDATGGDNGSHGCSSAFALWGWHPGDALGSGVAAGWSGSSDLLHGGWAFMLSSGFLWIGLRRRRR